MMKNSSQIINRATPGEILNFRTRPKPPVPQLSCEMALSLAAMVSATRTVLDLHRSNQPADEIAIEIAVALSDAGWAITPIATPPAPEAA